MQQKCAWALVSVIKDERLSLNLAVSSQARSRISTPYGNCTRLVLPPSDYPERTLGGVKVKHKGMVWVLTRDAPIIGGDFRPVSAYIRMRHLANLWDLLRWLRPQ